MEHTGGITTEADRTDTVIEGLGVSHGVGIGTAHVRESGAMVVPEYAVSEDEVEAERDRLKRAVAAARRQIRRLGDKARAVPGAVGEELGPLMDAYYHMLEDSRLLRGAYRRIAEDRINAESAVQMEIAELARGFATLDDSYIAARIVDIRDVGNRLVRNLTRHPMRPISQLPEGSIVVAEQLTPADTAQLDPERVAGFATVLGGAEGHTAIMARALGLPAVLGAQGLLQRVKTGDRIIVDGSTGRVVINPSEDAVSRYRRRRDEHERQTQRLATMRDLPAVTRDGVEVDLQANVELPMEMAMLERMGAHGIGLLRTEFLFMNRDDVPGEDEQYEALRHLIRGANGGPVTVRTLDIGGEKPAPALLGDVDESAVSALGLRGIRLSLARQDVLDLQLRAILRASRHGTVRILLPMVTTVREVRRTRDMLVKAAQRLRRRKIALPEPLPPIGAMIEVPGAALAADALARVSDFFAIGSNDLTMYTLAIDRANKHVAHLFDPLHPAVLRLIQFAVESALRARIPVSICGEMAAEPRFTPLLLGLGLRELSMTAASIPRVKQRIRELNIVAADSRARLIMDQIDSGRIATLLDDFNALA